MKRRKKKCTKMAATENQKFERLPNEAKKYIASLLLPKDAIAMSRTCHTINSDLSLSSLELPSVWPQRLIWKCEHRELTGDSPKRGPMLPTAPFSSAQSVTLDCTYRDQGWGNRKGRLYIVGHRRSAVGSEDEYACDPNDISQGRIVAQSPVAEHADASLRLTFFPRGDEAYHLWYTVGGGGGHQLHVSNAKQIVVVYDDVSQGTRNAFRYLSPLFQPNEREGPFLPLLTATLQSLTMMKEACNNGESSSSSVAMLEAMNEPILAHLQERGLDATNEDIIKALRNMIPRAQLVASIIRRNFADNSNAPINQMETFLRGNRGISLRGNRGMALR